MFGVSTAAPSPQNFSLGGIDFEVEGAGYGTKVFRKDSGGALIPILGNGTAPAALQISAAIEDPRLKSWLTVDDPSIKWDDLIRSTWAKDPIQALAVYGQQAARKPGGVDPTPDSAWFTDANYWPTVMAGFDGSTPALTQSVNELGTATPQNVAALNQWRADMSPSAQSKRNDPGGSLFGDILKAAAIASAVYFGGGALIDYFGAAGSGAAAGAAGAADAAGASALGTSGDALGFFTAGTDAAVNTSVADYIAAASAGLDTGAVTAFTSGLPLASLATSAPGFLAGAWQAAKTAESVVSTANTVSKMVSGPPKLSMAISPGSPSFLPPVFNPGNLFDTGANMLNTSPAQAAAPAMQTPFIMPTADSSLPVPLMMVAGFAAILFLVKK